MMRLSGVRVLGPRGLSEPVSMTLRVQAGPAEIDARNLVLSIGFMDLHAHLRDPGFPEKETLQSGTQSAAAGGFTEILAMANTEPVLDRPDEISRLLARAASAPIKVSLVGALTEGLRGHRPTDARALKAAGVIALSDDGHHALDAGTLVSALKGARDAGLPVFVHTQCDAIEDTRAAEAEAASQAIAALRLAEGVQVHLQHVSLGSTVEQLRAAREEGLALTAEVTPHHLALTQAGAVDLGPAGRVNPPLRSAADRDAVLQGLLDGVIDAVATDHAPHDTAAKQAGAPGFHGFETALGVLLRADVPWPVLYRALVEAPRVICGRRAQDEWVLIDPAAEWEVDPNRFQSRGRNTPFAGMRLRGRVVMTICRGRAVVLDAAISRQLRPEVAPVG
jgi:dihydroorotase